MIKYSYALTTETIIGFRVLFTLDHDSSKHEKSYEFRSRKSYISYLKRSVGNDLESCSARPWERLPYYQFFESQD